jgi:hypothetical protein
MTRPPAVPPTAVRQIGTRNTASAEAGAKQPKQVAKA